jgi:hypothetical protein
MSEPRRRPRYRIDLTPLPNQTGIPAQQLAQVLKSLLRAHGFRCVRAVELEGPEPRIPSPGMAVEGQRPDEGKMRTGETDE